MPSRAALDARCGTLADPVFLSHCFAAGVVSTPAGATLIARDAGHCAARLLVCLVVSVALVRGFEPAIGRLRDRIRPARAASSSLSRTIVNA